MHKLKICTNSFFVKTAYFKINCIFQSKLHISKTICTNSIFCQNCIFQNQHHMHSSTAYAFSTQAKSNVNCHVWEEAKNTKAPLLYNAVDKEICAVLKPYMQAKIFLFLIIFQLMLFQNQVHNIIF